MHVKHMSWPWFSVHVHYTLVTTVITWRQTRWCVLRNFSPAKSHLMTTGWKYMFPNTTRANSWLYWWLLLFLKFATRWQQLTTGKTVQVQEKNPPFPWSTENVFSQCLWSTRGGGRDCWRGRSTNAFALWNLVERDSFPHLAPGWADSSVTNDKWTGKTYLFV